MRNLPERSSSTGPTMCMNHPKWPAETVRAEYGPPLCEEVCWPGQDDPTGEAAIQPRWLAKNSHDVEGVRAERQCPMCPHGWDDHDATGCTAITNGHMCWC